MPGPVVGCAENIVNTVVFVRFHFFHVFSELDDIQSTFGCLFRSFLGTLGSLFLIFEQQEESKNKKMRKDDPAKNTTTPRASTKRQIVSNTKPAWPKIEM